MSDNSIKVSQVAQAANVASTDRVVILRNPSGNASLRTVEMGIFAANLTISNSVPANSSSNGVAGTIALNNSHLYLCVANNSWKRVALSSW